VKVEEPYWHGIQLRRGRGLSTSDWERPALMFMIDPKCGRRGEPNRYKEWRRNGRICNRWTERDSCEKELGTRDLGKGIKNRPVIERCGAGTFKTDERVSLFLRFIKKGTNTTEKKSRGIHEIALRHITQT